MCFLAACHDGDEPRARRLILAVPAAQREQYTTNCKQYGVDVSVASKKPDPATQDCEADPMSCQH